MHACVEGVRKVPELLFYVLVTLFNLGGAGAVVLFFGLVEYQGSKPWIWTWFCVCGWIAIGAAMGLAIETWIVCKVRRRELLIDQDRSINGLCKQCGYGLLGCSDRCPECGEPFGRSKYDCGAEKLSGTLSDTVASSSAPERSRAVSA